MSFTKSISLVYLPKYHRGVSPRGVVANVFNCHIVVSKFELQSRYYAHFRTNTLEKGINPLIPPAID